MSNHKRRITSVSERDKHMRKFFSNMKDKAVQTAVNCKVAMTKKQEGVDGIVIAIGLILVVALLLALFKDQIVDSVKQMMTQSKTQLDGLSNGINNPAP